MDPVTHAASGAVALLALRSRPATLWSLPVAALACASPDIDLAFIHTPLEFLQLHRGITHSFAGAPVLGLLLALLAWPMWRKATPDRWTFAKVWFFCICMILLHMWLDIVTTYGTMIFLPFSHYRVRLNAIFIVDLLITLPLLWAIWRWRTKRALIICALAWTFIYPSIGIAANLWHSSQWKAKLGEIPGATGKMVVFPDIFAPLFWRVLYEQKTEDQLQIVDQSVDFLGNSRAEPLKSKAAEPILTGKLAADSIAGDTYFRFAVLPVMADLRKEDEPEPRLPDSRLFMFYDLRFGSGLNWMRQLLAMRPNADMPFLLMAEFAPSPGAPNPENLAQMAPARIRLRFSDSGRDSMWHKPEPPQKPALWQWLVGIQ